MALVPVSFKSCLISALAAFPLVSSVVGGMASKAQAAEPWPAEVQAIYRVEFNGFDVGSFEFNSNVAGPNYTLTGDAQLSALLGAFRWQARTRSAGMIAADVPKPAGYTFDFAGTGKSGTVKMGFNGDGITSLSHVPPSSPAAGTVAVRDQHLRGVLDPLSAVMALSRSEGANPCARRLSIFDGKQRFDLALSFKRQERIAETRPTGQPSVAYVCKVHYVPIAGHRATEETRAMAMSDNIEISLRPVPSANLFIPHEINIPTGAGTARLIAQSVRITTRGEQIALGH